MFAVMYRAYIKPGQEEQYQTYWRKIASYFIEHKGAFGSVLHKSEGRLWVAYSRWPDKATRDASWPKNSISDMLPEDIQDIVQKLKDCIDSELPEIAMEVIDDLLIHEKKEV